VQRENFALLGGALRSLGWLSHIVGWLQEGLDQIEPVVQALRTKVEDGNLRPILGSALAQQGLLYFRQGRFEAALARYEESLVILRPLDDSGELVHALLISAIILHLYGAMDQAKARLVQSLASAQVIGHEWFAAYALYNLGYIASQAGDYEEGYQQMLDGLARWRLLGDPSSIALGLNYISPTAILLGRVEEAQVFLQESLALSTQVGDWWGVGTAHRNLGLAALAQGDFAEARAQLYKSLDIFGDIVVGWDIARSLDYLGRVSLAEGDLAVARKHFLQALRLALDVRTNPIVLDVFVGLARLHACAGEYEEALTLSLYALKDPAGVYETKEAASRMVTLAESHLSAWAVRPVRERVNRLSLELLAESILGGYSMDDRSASVE
jgi:tetratricopeptide (TPR) repeat protein